MRRRLELFRRHVWTWSVPLVVLLINVAWTVAFGSGARLRAADLESRLERAREEHASVASVRAEREQLWIGVTENRERLRSLYAERFATERERLTGILAELRDLAARTDLEPRTISYPEDELEDYDLLRRSFVFRVDGSYANLRQFLHLLELSPSFLAVEQLQVGETGRGGLSVAIQLSTLFSNEPASEPTPGEAS